MELESSWSNRRHWVDKNCLPWTKDYLSSNVVSTKADSETYVLEITEITTVLGDCDVTQRKGKVLCIYDMKLVFSVGGSKKDDSSEVSGSITIDEFVHDQDEDEYVFQIESEHELAIKQHLIPVLRAKLMKFQKDLITAHEKDVQHNT